MDTFRKTFPRVLSGTLMFGVLTAGCGGSSGPDDPEPTLTPTPTPTVSATPTIGPTASLVTVGARLFFQETFDGNGRTCGTCHPPETGFTLTPEFIASLPPDDPLFVAERVPELAGLENPELMRGPRALILENVDGFDRPPVFRGVPHIFDLAFAPPFGWGGTVFLLDDFVDAAVRQHFPRTLSRVPGVDFRLPTAEETAAMVAFMQSVMQVPDGTFGFDFNVLVRTEAEARGRDVFFGSGQCSFCHNGPLLTNGALFATGVTRRAVNVASPGLGALEDRDGTRFFDVPTLLGLAHSAPFFHDNSAGTIREAVAHYSSPEFNASEGGGFTFGIHMTEAEIDDVAAFLAALTTCGDGVANHGEPCDDGNDRSGDGCRPNCTLERCGDGIIDPGELCDDGVDEGCASRCDD